MKPLLTIILTFITIFGNCQNSTGIYQTTGGDLTPQFNQLQKRIDSLRLVINNNSIAYRAWQDNANSKIRQKSDSITLSKKQLTTCQINSANINTAIIRANDSLKLANYNIQYQFEQYKAQQFADTIELIGFPDTGTGNFTKITEKEYNIVPKFTWQIIKRYPVVTAQGIKTKEVTITELKQ